MPKISLILPYHDIPETALFLKRAIDSIMIQTYKDYEIVLVKNGKMAENTNSGIKRAKGDIIKVLAMDDYFAHENALQRIVDAFTGTWLITACDNNPHPYWTDDIHLGNNKLGGLSALTFINKDPFLFDEEMSWLLDCDYYKKLYNKYGEPLIIEDINVCIGIHPNQMTHTLSMDDKLSEHNYMQKKYAK